MRRSTLANRHKLVGMIKTYRSNLVGLFVIVFFASFPEHLLRHAFATGYGSLFDEPGIGWVVIYSTIVGTLRGAILVMIIVFVIYLQKRKLLPAAVSVSTLFLLQPLNWLNTHQEERNDSILRTAYYLTFPFSRFTAPVEDRLPPPDIPCCIPPNTQVAVDDRINGVFGIATGKGLKRTFTWKGASRSIELQPSLQNGQKILKFPDRVNASTTPLLQVFHWPIHDGITRCQIQEQVQNFDSLNQATSWSQKEEAEGGSVAYTNDGLLIEWSKSLRLHTLRVYVCQLRIKGKKPTALPGANRTRMRISEVAN